MCILYQTVPESATPVSGSSQPFSEYFHGKSSSDESLEPLSVCPVTSVSSHHQASPLTQQWSQLKKTECDTDKAFCWMNCLSLPSEPCDHVVCRNSEDRPCCTDTVTDNCANMDSTCGWQCSAGDSNHSHTTLEHVSRLAHTEDSAFCNGAGTDMFMQGFQVTIAIQPVRMSYFIIWIFRPVVTARMFV